MSKLIGMEIFKKNSRFEIEYELNKYKNRNEYESLCSLKNKVNSYTKDVTSLTFPRAKKNVKYDASISSSNRGKQNTPNI